MEDAGVDKRRFELDFLAEYSDAALVAEIHRVASVVGKSVLTKADFQRYGKVSTTTLLNRFGSWQDVLARAGLDHLYSGASVTDRMRNLQKTRAMTNEEIIDLIREASARSPAADMSGAEFQTITGISRKTVARRFGSWANAAREAGVEVRTRGVGPYSDERCFANLLEVWTHHGRCPIASDMDQPPSTVGRLTYIKHWGTWRKALAAFVDWANRDESDDAPEPVCPPVDDSVVEQTARDVRAACDRHEISLRMRFRVLQRDRFRCVVCGRSPATELGVKLHVDHTVPFARGGRTVIDNLRSLCSDCNLGKGDLMPE